MTKTLFFLTSTVKHKKYFDRIAAAIDAGYVVVVLGFDRANEHNSAGRIDERRVHYLLVRVPSQFTLVGRLFLLSKLIGKIIYARFHYGQPDVVLVNAADFLVVATVFFNYAARKIYDLADINPVQYGSSLVSIAFRKLESIALKYGWEVVVTSPWFYWVYLAGILKSTQRCYLIENKLVGERRLAIPVRRLSYISGEYTVGWSGLLRCNRSFDVLLALCERGEKNVGLNLIGDVSNLDPALIVKAKSLRNVEFSGAYLENEIGNKLVNTDFLWACDLSDGLNSELLLPNRLYQGVFYGKPLIAEEGTATAKVVKHFDIGVILQKCTNENLARQLKDVSQEQYDCWVSNCTHLRERSLRGAEWRNFLVDVECEVVRLPHTEVISVVFHDNQDAL